MEARIAGSGPEPGRRRPRRWLLLAGLVLALGAAGCSKTRLEIESDGCWDGLINDTVHISSCGNKKYDVSSGFECVVLQKLTGVGWLRARIVNHTPWIETRDSLGIIRLCK